jgi:hypothetical protein
VLEVEAMTIPDWLKSVIASVLGSGVVVAFVTQRFARGLADRARLAEFRRSQLVNLYGPLGYHVELCDRALKNSKAVLGRGTEFTKKFGTEPSMRSDSSERAEKQLDLILDVANRHILEVVLPNAKRCNEILVANWGWLEPEDYAAAGDFAEDLARLDVEFPERKRRLPLPFYTEGGLEKPLSVPSFIRPEFIQAVRGRIRTLKTELSGLSGSRE